MLIVMPVGLLIFARLLFLLTFAAALLYMLTPTHTYLHLRSGQGSCPMGVPSPPLNAETSSSYHIVTLSETRIALL